MGEYYYIELKFGHKNLPLLHRKGCMKNTLPRENVIFLGTFYRPADALLTAKKAYKKCNYCSICCKT
ncbi:hypothetical protein ACP3UV_17325 [Mixta calida]